MAVGKGSMTRASKEADTAAKAELIKKEAAKARASTKTKTTAKAADKSAVSGVVEAQAKEVMEKIIYQSSSQMLDRDAKPGETFGIGDAMPVYFF